MNQARLFSPDGKAYVISADDVLNGKVDRHSEFIDLEYEFKVQFVKNCKGHKGPYFRLYLSREDYRRLSEDQKSKYNILKKMRHHQESAWHEYWKEKFKAFCEIEKTINSKDGQRYKRADAYCDKIKTCFEFQHSFIDKDFEKRNSFYKELGIETIWLYDLTSQGVKQIADNEFEILENNSKGFFKISDFKDNLEKYQVYFQTKDKLIYRITKLGRKEIDDDKKSTIRTFHAINIWTEDEFIKNASVKRPNNEPKTIGELWKTTYYAMVVEDTEKMIRIKIRGRKDGTIYRDYQYNNIEYKYVDERCIETSTTKYHLSKENENKRKWRLVKSYPRYNYKF